MWQIESNRSNAMSISSVASKSDENVADKFTGQFLAVNTLKGTLVHVLNAYYAKLKTKISSKKKKLDILIVSTFV